MQTAFKRFFYICILTGYAFMLKSVFFKAGSFLIASGAFLAAAAFTAVTILGRKANAFFEKRYIPCAVVIIVLAAILQCINIESLRYTPLYDLGAVFEGAKELVETGDFATYHWYFGYYFNNYGALRVLYHVFRIGHIFTGDYFLIAAVFNEITILLTFLFASLITKKLFGARFGILTLLFFVSMPPFIFMTDVFYTDSLSMLYPLIMIYIALMNRDRSKVWQWILCVLFALAAFIGGTIKANVYIVPVAVCIVELVYKNFKKFFQYLICLLVICIGLNTLSTVNLYRNYIPKEDLARTKTPAIHWVMMGLEGNGRFRSEDEEFTRSFDDPEERNREIMQKRGERIRKKGFFGMIALLTDKSYIDYGDGTLGLSDFLDDVPVNESPLHTYILYEGDHYGRYYKFCCMIFYAILLLGGVCVCSEFTGVIKKQDESKKQDVKVFVPALAVFGDYAFLMMWEATNRYCSNFVPLIIILATGGVYYFEIYWNKIRVRKS